MNKISEMTINEFKEALNEIFKSEEEENKEKKHFFETLVEFLSFKPFKAFMSEPVTKEVFIRRGKKIKNVVWDIIETVIFVVVAIILIRFFIAEIRWIPSASMHPTLIEGDVVFVDRFSRFKTTPQRGDIMIFYPPNEVLETTPWKVFSRLTGFFCKDIAYIKRVIGVPGDKLEIKRDEYGIYRVFIDDNPLYETYIKNPLDYTPCTQEMFCGP
ncbi:signal peptidase I, partial [bacterium]|nr:signal peptidase I [bacterium]